MIFHLLLSKFDLFLNSFQIKTNRLNSLSQFLQHKLTRSEHAGLIKLKSAVALLSSPFDINVGY